MPQSLLGSLSLVGWGEKKGLVSGLSPALFSCLLLWASCSLYLFLKLISLPLVSTLFQGVGTWRRSIKPALLQLLGRELFPGGPWFGVGG